MDRGTAASHFSAARKSGLWQFFTLTEHGDKKLYTCNLCKERFVYAGNTNVLSSHMKLKHPQNVRIAPKPNAQPPKQPSYSTATAPQPITVKQVTAPAKEKPSEKNEKTIGDNMSTAGTPNKAKDKERIVKLLHESILHLCKVSVSGPGEIEVDGIVCITQPNDSDIVVKVHETFSNVHNADKDGEDGKSPAPGEKRKAGSHGDATKTPRKEDGKDRSGERQRTPVSRRLISDIDLTGDDDQSKRPHRSPHRARNNNTDVIDLTSGRDTPAPNLHITQVRSMAQQQRFNGPMQYNQRFGNYRPRGPYNQRGGRPRYTGRPTMGPPGVRQMGGNVVPIGGPIPHRGFGRGQNGAMMGNRGQAPGAMQNPRGPNVIGQVMQPNNMNTGGATPDRRMSGGIDSFKGLRCKYKDCGFSCSNKYYLETHVLQHFDSSPFSCNEEGCDFKTKNKQNLYQHYKVSHDANNPQFCFKCIKAFKSPEALNTHTSSCQVMSIKCDHCGENIQGLMAMARHLTEVYIAESEASQGSSPANTPSPAQAGLESPGLSSPSMSSPAGVPDMSSPLNIIPDVTSAPSPAQNQGGVLIHQELEKLEQMSSDIQQQQMLTGTDPPMPGYISPNDLLQQTSNQSGSDTTSSDQPMSTNNSFPYVVNHPLTTSQSQEPVTLDLPVQMASDIQLPPGAEAITLELVPLGNNDGQQQDTGNDADKPPDLGTE